MKCKVETANYFVYEVEADNLEDAEILAKELTLMELKELSYDADVTIVK